MIRCITAAALLLTGCATSLPWPEQIPELTQTEPQVDTAALSREAAMEAISGHYAHYDVVAYEDSESARPMRTFVISYGFTDFVVEQGELVEYDRFCHAEHKINYKTVQSFFNDSATQAIKPPSQVVSLARSEQGWKLYRPATPSLLGIDGDPNVTLTTDKNHPDITDADNDGNPGVTVKIRIAGLVTGELYLIRREIFSNHMWWYGGDTVVGHVEDESEQLVLGASMSVLDKPSNPDQLPDPGMNPIVLVRIDESLQDCDELMARRDEFFPAEPTFY